jgi:hypothetical protein
MQYSSGYFCTCKRSILSFVCLWTRNYEVQFAGQFRPNNQRWCVARNDMMSRLAWLLFWTVTYTRALCADNWREGAPDGKDIHWQSSCEEGIHYAAIHSLSQSSSHNHVHMVWYINKDIICHLLLYVPRPTPRMGIYSWCRSHIYVPTVSSELLINEWNIQNMFTTCRTADWSKQRKTIT